MTPVAITNTDTPKDNTPIVVNKPPAEIAVPESVESQYVKNSSFLSRDIEAHKLKQEIPNTHTLKKVKIVENVTQKKEENIKPAISTFKNNKEVKPVSISPPKEIPKKVVTKEVSFKTEKQVAKPCLAPVQIELNKTVDDVNIKPTANVEIEKKVVADNKKENETKAAEGEESNGVGDKIKIFEKAAEDANNSSKLSRPGSVRGRNKPERLGSDSSKEDVPPTPPPRNETQKTIFSESRVFNPPFERQSSLTKNINPNIKKISQGYSSDSEKVIKKPEPQRIIKPEFKQLQTPAELTIRSPSLGAKMSDQFPSQGTAFRNVTAPSDSARNEMSHREAFKFNDDVNTQNNVKGKVRGKEKTYSVSKGSSYYTRGSEEIWLVKKKDIEEIEERVLDSIRRAGGNSGSREGSRPSSESGQASFMHATIGRKRQMYTRSESLDPQWSGRAQTLKRQTSVACTCGHDKKPRAKSAGADSSRPRSRSHGDDNTQGHVLDKYETLV